MINYTKRNKDKDADNKVGISEELQNSLEDSDMTPTKDFLISLSKIVGILVVVLVLFLAGRWIWQSADDDEDKDKAESSEVAEDESSKDSEADDEQEASDDQDAGVVTVATPEDNTEGSKGDVDATDVEEDVVAESLPDAGLDYQTTLTTIVGLVAIVIASTLWHKLVFSSLSNRK